MDDDDLLRKARVRPPSTARDAGDEAIELLRECYEVLVNLTYNQVTGEPWPSIDPVSLALVVQTLDRARAFLQRTTRAAGDRLP